MDIKKIFKGRSINVARGIFYGIWSRGILILGPFLTKTAIIYTLGIRYVGLDSLFSSVLQILNFTELGIGSALIYSMYKPIAEHNISQVNELLNFYKKCYRIIGFIVMVLGCCILPFLNKIINKDVPEDLNIYILYLIVLFDTVLGYFLFAYRKSLLLANQRVDLINKADGIINIIKNVIQILLLVVIQNFYLFYSVRIVFTALGNLISAWYSTKYFPEYSPQGKVEPGFLSQLKKKVAGLICSKFGNVVLVSVDSVVISTFLGLTVLGQYNSYFSIINSAVSLIAVLSFAFLPSVGNYLIQETKEQNYKIFRIINFSYGWIITWFSAIMLSLFQPFMSLWIGEKNILPNSVVILLVLYFYIYKSRESILLYYDAAGLWWEGWYIQLLSAAFNLIVNIILVRYIGLYGILISTILAIVIFDLPLVARTVFKKYFDNKKNLLNYFITQIKQLIVMLVTVFGTGMICHMVCPKQTIPQFLLRIAISVVLPHLYLLLLNKRSNDFINVKNYFYNKLRK